MPILPLFHCRPAAVACLLLACCAPLPAAEPALQVLHWWTSASERRAADLLARRLGEEGIEWRDAAIPGGAGLGAAKVLRSRMLAQNAPEVTQIIGVSIREWAEMGLLLELDAVATSGQWTQVLFPTIHNLVRQRGHVVAAPLGIHRINTLHYNRAVFNRLGLTPPATWADFEQIAPRLQAAGVQPLAQSGEPWQVATLFENLVLAEGGPSLHQDLFVRHSPQAVTDPRLAQALLRLRGLKRWMSRPVQEQPWPALVRQVARGESAMLVMGDWAKSELSDPRGDARAGAPDTDLGCTTAPDTARYHLYSVDTLTMLAGNYQHAAAQAVLARLITSPAMQAEYNLVKGSVPVRRDADPGRMDACARASWTAFGQAGAQQVPSLVHRMATDEASKDVIVAEVHRYFSNDELSPADAQRRLAAVLRAVRSRSQPQ